MRFYVSQSNTQAQALQLPDVGSVIADRYKVVKMLGRGGSGAVYEGVQLVLDQQVAIKVILPDGADDEWYRGRFINEARIYAKINSPYVVKVYDFGREKDDSLFLVMEYLPGLDLREVLKHDGHIGTTRLCRLASHMLQGLTAAHELGIIHRDLKPRNVMILDADTDKPFAKVLDFGISKVDASPSFDKSAPMPKPGDASGFQHGLTMLGPTAGTPAFMAPEQIMGADTDARTDIYSMGVMLYEMACGQLPFLGPDLNSLLLQHVHEAPADLRTVNPDVHIPARLEDIIMVCLEKKPENRYQTARELLGDIDHLAEEHLGPKMVSLMDATNSMEGSGHVPVSTRSFGGGESAFAGLGQDFDALERDEQEAEAAENKGPAAPEDIRLVTDMMTHLGKAYKSFQLYPRDNPVYAAAIDAVCDLLDHYFVDRKRLAFNIDRFAIIYEKVQVYEDTNLRDSYPFKLFSDGVRRLFFHKGMKRQEISEYFDCLHKVSTNTSLNSDLVTLMWERELPHIKFLLVEDLVEENSPDVKFIQKAVGRTGYGGSPDQNDSRRRKNKRSNARVRNDRSRFLQPLSDAETNDLVALLADDAKADHVRGFIMTLLSVLKASKDVAEVKEVLKVLGQICTALLKVPDLDHALMILMPLKQIVTRRPDTPVAAQIKELLDDAQRPQFIHRAIESMKDHETDAHRGSVGKYLKMLDARAVPTILSDVPELDEATELPIIQAALLHLCKDTPDGLRDGVTSNRVKILLATARVLGELPGRTSAEMLTPLLHNNEPGVRLQALRSLARIKPNNLGRRLEMCLSDRDGDVRSEAVKAFATLPESESRGPLIAVLNDKRFATRSRSEQVPVLRALAGMKSAAVVHALEQHLIVKKTWINKPPVLIGGSLTVLTALGLTLGWLVGAVAWTGCLIVVHFAGFDLRSGHYIKQSEMRGPIIQALRRMNTDLARQILKKHTSKKERGSE